MPADVRAQADLAVGLVFVHLAAGLEKFQVAAHTEIGESEEIIRHSEPGLTRAEITKIPDGSSALPCPFDDGKNDKPSQDRSLVHRPWMTISPTIDFTGTDSCSSRPGMQQYICRQRRRAAYVMTGVTDAVEPRDAQVVFFHGLARSSARGQLLAG